MVTGKSPILHKNFLNETLCIIANMEVIDLNLQDEKNKDFLEALYIIICKSIPKDCLDVADIKTEFMQVIFPVKPLDIDN